MEGAFISQSHSILTKSIKVSRAIDLLYMCFQVIATSCVLTSFAGRQPNVCQLRIESVALLSPRPRDEKIKIDFEIHDMSNVATTEWHLSSSIDSRNVLQPLCR